MVKIFSMLIFINATVAHALGFSKKEQVYNNKIQQGLTLIKPKLLEKINKDKTQIRMANSDNSKSKARLNTEKIKFKILISDAMGQNELKKLISSLAYRNDVSFVIRGMLNTEKTIGDVSKRVINLIKGFKQVPNVILDSRPFKAVNAVIVPTILAYQGKKLIAQATGIANPVWMKLQLAEGKKGDLGNFGTGVAIAEKDIAEILKERIAKLDSKKLIAQAKNNYWKKAKFLSLPNAVNQNIRRFKPEITINETLYDANNEVIFFAGTKINTLSQLPFTHRIVVFDATNENHIKFVKNLTEIANLTTRLITTRFDRNKGWKAVKYIEDELDKPVYLLNKDILTAFDLKVVPSVIVADSKTKEFVISEYKL